MDLRLRTLDGRDLDLHVTGGPIWDRAEHLIGAVGILHDQTEHMRAEAALRASEERYRAVIETQTELVSRFLPDTTLTFVNEAACRNAGKSRAELLGTKFIEALPDTARTLVQATIRSLLAHPGVATVEHEFIRPDGALGWQQWVNRTILDDHGQVMEFQSVGRDITERRQLEQERDQALRRSEEWFRSMANTAPVLLWVAGTDGLVTFVNEPWLRFTGRTLEQELGNGWAEGIHPDDAQRYMETYLTAFRARQRFTMEYRLRRADGEYRWLLNSGVPRVGSDGGFAGYIGSAIDVTEREQLIQEREQAQARELAAHAVAEQLDTFFATAAHDIRSPVTALIGNVQMARVRAERLVTNLQSHDGQLADLATPVLETLHRADKSGDRLLRLVPLLFDLARARTGTLTLTLARTDLVAVVREQVAAQHTAVPGRAIQLDLPDQQVLVMADADRLGQVLTNYLTNALKYSADDQPVEVRLEATDGLAVVSVQDYGPGLPPDEQSRVWGPYHRAPDVMVRGSAGASSESLGLGLHICKQLIELHPGGAVGITSAVGAGSTFWFRLPVVSGHAIEQPQALTLLGRPNTGTAREEAARGPASDGSELMESRTIDKPSRRAHGPA
jgi:PAS domain S-box-containing protein